MLGWQGMALRSSGGKPMLQSDSLTNEIDKPVFKRTEILKRLTYMIGTEYAD